MPLYKVANWNEGLHQLAESKEESEIIVSHAAYGYWEEALAI